jgi:hypothetical protein
VLGDELDAEWDGSMTQVPVFGRVMVFVLMVFSWLLAGVAGPAAVRDRDPRSRSPFV